MADPIAQLCQIIAEVLRDAPTLDQADLVERVEGAIAANAELLSALKTDEQMLQINQGNAIAFQTLVSGGTAYIGPQVRMEPAQLQSLVEGVIQHLQTTMPQIQQAVKGDQNLAIGSMRDNSIAIAHVEQLVLVDRYSSNVRSPETIDFSGYLQSLITSYQHWQTFYTLTDAEGRQQQDITEPPVFDFGLMVQTVQKERKPEQSGQNREKENIERLLVLDGLRKYADQQVLLVGRPGSGKSTALARLLLEEAISQKSKLLQNSDFSSQLRIPVLVELRYWQGSIDQLILKSFKRHSLTLTIDQLESVLFRSLILFDGINELPSEEARSQLSAFRRDHPKLPIIFTTRDLSLGGDLGIEKKLEMQPLKPEQMETFVRAYVPEQAEEMLRQLKDRLRELATTPLLLWMLCQLFQQTGQIPENLGMVFRLFTQGYERNLKQDVVIESDRDWWKPVLQQLAWMMMQGEKPTEFRVAIKRDAAVRAIAQFLDGKVPYAEDFARKCLRDLQKHHLIQAGIGYEEIEFRHQMIQDYYAAEALLERLPNLTDEQLKRDYLNYLKWTEPIAFMLALVDDESQALQVVRLALNDVDLMLGARFAGEVKPVFQETTVAWITQLAVPLDLKITLLGRTCSSSALSELLQASTNHFPNIRVSAAFALEEIGGTDAIEGLLKTLEDADSSVRLITAEALGKIGGELAVPGLIKALEDADSSVRFIAAKALGEIGGELAVLELLQALEHGIPSVREGAAYALEKIGNRIAESGLLKVMIKRLLKALEDSYMRWSAAKALEEIGGETAIQELLKALENKSPAIRETACAVLGKIGDETVIKGLLKALGDSECTVRHSAAEALRKVGNETAVEGLLEALKDETPSVYRSAAYALGEVGGEAAIPGLLKALGNSDFDVRKIAADGIGKIGGETAIKGLYKALENSDFRIRHGATLALGKLHNEAATAGLLKALEDSESYVRQSAIDALRELGNKDITVKLLKALADPASSVRKSAAYTLGDVGSEIAVTELLKLLEDPDIRQGAAYALGRIGGKSAVAGLLQSLTDQDSELRQIAAGALGEIGGETAVAGLLKALEDSNSSVSWSAACALGKPSSKAAVGGLITALKHQYYYVRRHAAYALGEIGDETAVAGLLEALESLDTDLQRSIVEALRKIGSKAAVVGLLKLLKDPDLTLRQSTVEALGAIGGEAAEAKLLKLLKSRDSYIHRSAIEALRKIGSPVSISSLYQLCSSGSKESLSLIATIQNRCQFYNYELWQKAESIQKATTKRGDQ